MMQTLHKADLPWSSRRFLPHRSCEAIFQIQQMDSSVVVHSSAKGLQIQEGHLSGCLWDTEHRFSSGILFQRTMRKRETKNGVTLGEWVADVQGVVVVVGPSEEEVGLEEVCPASWTSQVRTMEVETRRNIDCNSPQRTGRHLSVCSRDWSRGTRLTFGEQVGLADGDRMALFWMRSSRGGTGGRPRCCRERPGSPPWAFLCWLTGEELGDTMGEFCCSAQC